MEMERVFRDALDLQLFATDADAGEAGVKGDDGEGKAQMPGGVADTVDDDPEIEIETEIGDIYIDGDDTDGAQASAGSDDDHDEGDVEDAQASAADEEPEAEDADEEKVYTQEDLNRIIGHARIQGRENEEKLRRLQTLTGMDLEGIISTIEQQQVSSIMDERGLTEEEARIEVAKDRENKLLRQQLEDREREDKAREALRAYEAEKAAYVKDPFVNKYLQEIDAFSGLGQACSFKLAMEKIIGEKFISGEIRKALTDGTAQKVMRDIQKAQKAPVEGGSMSGPSEGDTNISRESHFLDRQMGIPLKESAKYQAQYEQEKKKGIV